MTQTRLNFLLRFILFMPTFLLFDSFAQQKIIPTYNKPDTIIGRLLLDTDTSKFTLVPYDSNYFIHTYTSDINKDSIRSYYWADNARKDETKFKISLGFPIYRGILGENSLIGASYTQHSWWQSSNRSQSSPFRETNYEPQLFVGFLTGFRILDFTVKEMEFGLNHQSNGRPEKTSRSWNRLYIRTSATKNNFRIGLKVWSRLPEKLQRSDDNPLIIGYLGHYQFSIGYVANKATFIAKGRYNWNKGNGNAEFSISYQIAKNLRLYTQLFSGYGESMIDYDHKQTRFGLGIMLNDVFY